MQRDELLLLCAFNDWLAEKGYRFAKAVRVRGGRRWMPATPQEVHDLGAAFLAAVDQGPVTPSPLDSLNTGVAIAFDTAPMGSGVPR